MAKFTFTPLLGKFGSLAAIYDEQTLKLDKGGSGTHAEYTDTNGGEHIVFSGTGFQYGKHGFTGTIHSISFENSDGEAMVTVTDGDFSAKSLTKTLTGTNGVEIFLDMIHAGNDKITGSSTNDYLTGGMGDDTIDGGKGNDQIYGGKGHDHMQGGAGSDQFLFSPDSDVVDDFDANGGGSKQDYIVGNFKDIDVAKSDDGVVLTMADGSTMTLLHVKASEITSADFVI